MRYDKIKIDDVVQSPSLILYDKWYVYDDEYVYELDSDEMAKDVIFLYNFICTNVCSIKNNKQI